MRTGAQDPPWRVIRAFPTSNESSFAHIHNVSGGVLAGDSLRLDVHVAAGAAAQLTTTGATRLYRHRVGEPASEQKTFLQVGPRALLEYLPDQLIPFAGSRHHQQTDVLLADGATFFSWEVLAPGRQAMGETFAFDTLRIETNIRSDARPILLEDFTLRPDSRPLPSLARLGEYQYMASFYAIEVGRSPRELRELETSLAQIASEESCGGTIWGTSALASDGVIVRGLSNTSRTLPATLLRYWNVARRFLTGVDAVPPRKLK
jgi:urease accessory protein